MELAAVDELLDERGLAVFAEDVGDAALDQAARAELEAIVLRAYRATGCRDYGRIDLRLRGGTFYVIDVNPNPDINPLTSLTYAAAEAGYSYGELGSRIVNLAAARHPVFRSAGRPPDDRSVPQRPV